MVSTERIAWLARRAGWGLAPGELDALRDAPTDDVISHFLAGRGPAPDPWADMELAVETDQPLPVFAAAIQRWLDHFASTTEPAADRMTWLWHDHFAVSARVVRSPLAVVEHMRLLRTHALGNFRDLLRAVTTDAAMLVFLDGAQSTGDAPNENYGRELLELYSVGFDAYTEADVRAASIALTGWTINRRQRAVRFVPRRHDDTPQTLLGRPGVRDVDTVVDAVVSNPACAPFITGKIAASLLGPGVDPAVTAPLSTAFAADLEIRPLLDGLMRLGLDGVGGEVVDDPVTWLVAAARALDTGATPVGVIRMLEAMGQVPAAPPNVGGFPPPSAYLSASTTAARVSVAGQLAQRAREGNPAHDAARAGDLDALAMALGRPDGFGPTTAAALAAVDEATPASTAVARLTLALVAPELVIA